MSLGNEELITVGADVWFGGNTIYTVYMYSILHRFTLYSSHASALMWQMHCRTFHIAQYAVRNVSSYNKKKTFERKLFYLSE